MREYVTVEGVEGVGKSYYLEKLRDDPQFFVILDDDVDAEALEVLESLRTKDIFFRSKDPMKEFDGFSKVDLIIIRDKVKPMIKKGKIIIQDRGADTTCLYAALQLADQGKGELIALFKRLFEKRKALGLVSERVILLVDNVEKCIERAERRNNKKYTNEQKEFVRKVDEGFRRLAKEFPQRYIVIDLSTEKNVLHRIKEVLDDA